jgi:hypothetical protein
MCPLPGACSRWRIHRGPNTKSSRGPGIKRDSTYRLGFVVVEYRWHPLYGKKLRLLRRTAHSGAAVVHVETSRTVSRELPAWMVDGSVCRGMELGPPQVSIAALNDLRAVIAARLKAKNQLPGFVSSLVKESESCETAEKSIVPTIKAAGIRNSTTSGRENPRESDRRPRRSATGSARRDDRRISGGKK